MENLKLRRHNGTRISLKVLITHALLRTCLKYVNKQNIEVKCIRVYSHFCVHILNVSLILHLAVRCFIAKGRAIGNEPRNKSLGRYLRGRACGF
jgi:hypothetical protein